MSANVPCLSDLLNFRPDSKYQLQDTNITARCPSPDCFTFQSLADATLTVSAGEARYACTTCDATVAVVRPKDGVDPGLSKGETLEGWTAWIPPTGINIRLANTTRVRRAGSAQDAG